LAECRFGLYPDGFGESVDTMILHVDMDAFYASVEELDWPELAGIPVIVGGDPRGRGVVSAANYPARQFGVHSAMPSAKAVRLCPQAVFLKPRMQRYAELSSQIREIFFRFTPLVEPLSLDEAFLDVSGSTRLFGTAEEIGRRIQRTIDQELRLPASVGVAPNKFLAKLASDLEKPRGVVLVPPDGVQAFLDPLPLARIWGVGRSAQKRFDRLGVHTISQLRQLTQDVLRDYFGSHGETLWELAHGRDSRLVVPDHQAKSISHETTFAVDVEDLDVLRTCLLELTEQVARRLRSHQLRGRTVTLKIRTSDFQTLSRGKTLPQPSDSTWQLWKAARELLELRSPAGREPVRLIGVGVSGLERPGQRQRDLFDEVDHQRDSRLDAVKDAIRDRFGRHALASGKRPTTHPSEQHSADSGRSGDSKGQPSSRPDAPPDGS
jgi:DNA polymerase-4